MPRASPTTSNEARREKRPDQPGKSRLKPHQRRDRPPAGAPARNASRGRVPSGGRTFMTGFTRLFIALLPFLTASVATAVRRCAF